MQYVLFIGLFLALAGEAQGQEVAAPFTASFEDQELPDIVVVGASRSFEERDEYQGPVRSSIVQEQGYAVHETILRIASWDGGRFEYRSVDVEDRIGRDFGAGEPNNDGVRLAWDLNPIDEDDYARR